MLSLIDVRSNACKLFTSIAIETSSLCNRKCAFCPVAYGERPDEYMSWELYGSIIGELAELNYSGRVELYIYNEPMRDTRLVEMIKYARSLLPRACIMINTNGDYINGRADVEALVNAGINQLGINIYSNTERECTMLEIVSSFPSAYSLYQNIGSKKVSVKVIPKYDLYHKGADVDVPGVAHISNRSGNIPDFRPALEEPLSKMCTRPFRFFNVDWRGRGLVCCNDYYADIEIGNVQDTSCLSVWSSVLFNMYRLKLQCKDRLVVLCDVCDYTGGYYPHMTHHVTFGEETDELIRDLDLSDTEYLYDVAETICGG